MVKPVRKSERGVALLATLMAVALMLVIEGLLPFLAPSAWRETFRRLMQLTDGQIRFFGLSARRRNEHYAVTAIIVNVPECRCN